MVANSRDRFQNFGKVPVDIAAAIFPDPALFHNAENIP
jgi:hypothetical protein